MKWTRRGIIALVLAVWALARLSSAVLAQDADLDAGLTGFEMVAENEHLALYLRSDGIVEFAVLQKASGNVWYSNPYDRERKEVFARGSAKAMLNAQVIISYFDVNRQIQMDSHNDSVAHGQHTINLIEGGFRVDYQIGRIWNDQDYMPLVISEERFNERILAHVERERDREFLRSQYVLVELERGYVDPEPYSIAGVDLDRLLGEYGLKVHDSLRPQDRRRLLQEYLVKVRDAKGYTSIGQVKFEDIEALVGTPTLMLRWDVREWDKEAIWELARAAGYTPEDVIHDHETYGISPPYPNLRTFQVSVEFFLDGPSLVARIPGESISYPDRVIDPATGNRVTYPLTNISLLPYFGASDTASDGYLFVPDGSGALIYANSNKTGVQPYSGLVYGRDLAAQLLPEFSSVDLERIYLPVFGLKDGDRAFVGIIENGDGIARIEATVAGMHDSFNKVWASFDVMPQVRVNLEAAGARIGLRQLALNMYQVRPYRGDITTRYYFLNGDDADYVGMAKRYREYLAEHRGLSRVRAPESLPFLLHVVGGIDRIQPVFGIPSRVVVPLTTFEQVGTIVRELGALGVEGVHLRYLGWLEGGMRHVFPDRVRVEPKVGTKSGLVELNSALESMGARLYLDAGFAFVRNNRLFDGFIDFLHASRFLNRDEAYVTNYNIATYQPIDSERKSLLSPSQYPRVIGGFAEDSKRLGMLRLSVGDLGKHLYSDFRLDPDELVDRQTALQIVVGQLAALREQGFELLLEGANAYALPYATHVVDAPMVSRGQAIIDQSVPFYAIATSGYLARWAPPANLSDLPRDVYLLRLLETGMLPTFMVAFAPSSEVKHTDYHRLYRIHFDSLKDEITAVYHEARDVLQKVWNQPIVDHACEAAGVCRSLFEDGTLVIVNYGREAYRTEDGAVVPARGFRVVEVGKEGDEGAR